MPKPRQQQRQQSSAQRIDCNKLLMKASHGLTQCPPKVSSQANQRREGKKLHGNPQQPRMCAVIHALSACLSLSLNRLFFMVSLEKSFVYKHLDNFLDFYANIAIVRGECMSRNGLKSFLIRFALQKKNFFFLLFSVVLLQQ